MTLQLTLGAEKKVGLEIERLTYSAYLLTLDPSVSFSVVIKALDDSLDEVTTSTNLLHRIVELSLQQLRHEPIGEVDRESSAFEVIVYADYKASGSSRLLPFQDDAGMNPILALDAVSRIAFVVHHVLGYPVNEAATLAHVKQKEFRSHLRHAYVTARKPGPAANIRRGLCAGVGHTTMRWLKWISLASLIAFIVV